MQVNFDFESYRAMFSGGARTYLFFIPFNFPGGTQVGGVMDTFGLDKNSRMFPYLVKSANLPETSFEEVSTQLNVFGYKTPGNKTYGDWTITLNIDDKGLVLDKFHAWQSLIYDIHTGVYGAPVTYMLNQDFYLLDNSGNAIKTFKLKYCWPKSISEVTFDYSQAEIASFSVTFSYMYYEASDTSATSAAIQGFIKSAFEKLIG